MQGFMKIRQIASRYHAQHKIVKLKEWVRYFFCRSKTSNVEFESVDGLRGFAILIIIASVVSHKRMELFRFVLRERGNVQPG